RPDGGFARAVSTEHPNEPLGTGKHLTLFYVHAGALEITKRLFFEPPLQLHLRRRLQHQARMFVHVSLHSRRQPCWSGTNSRSNAGSSSAIRRRSSSSVAWMSVSMIPPSVMCISTGSLPHIRFASHSAA